MRIPALACTLLLGACAAPAPDAGTTVTDSAGIRIVSNDPAQRGWGREDAWALSGNPTLQVGNVLGNPDHELYRVAHARRLADGGIVVANTGLGDIRVFDAQGGHVRTIALAADAAEKAPPLRVYPLGGDTLLVFQGDLSLTRYGGDGERAVRSTLATPGDDLETPQPVGSFRDGSLLFRSRFPWDDAATGVGRRRARLLHYATDGSLIGTFGEVDDDGVLNADHGAYIFNPTGVAAAGDSTVWYGPGDRYELREIAPDGRTLRIVRLDKLGTPVQQADITAYRSAVIDRVKGTSRETTMEATLEASVFADTFPVFDQMIVDDVGNLWVRNYQWFDLGAGKGWSVFDAEGRYLGDVTTPSILEIHQIGDDFVLGRMSDRAGREAVYLFRLQKPEREAAGDSSAAPPP